MISAIEFQQVSFAYGVDVDGRKQRGKGLFGGRTRKGASDAAAQERRAASLGAGVHDLNFAIEPGEFVAIIGNNGAGKTTTSKLMNGLLKPTSGRVLVEGVSTLDVRTSDLASRVGMLFQNPDRQICQSTVVEEVAFGLRVRGVVDADQRAARVVEDFGLDAQAVPFALSRGERQRLALASVVACEPAVLILDEPTTGLDYKECVRIMNRANELNRAGTTVVMVCHDMEVVADFARRVLVMANGRLIADGAPERVFRDRAAMEAASVCPPQMIELGMRFEGERRFEGLFDRVDDVRGMVEAVAVAASGSVGSEGDDAVAACAAASVFEGRC